mgnify:CR=1 FL=1
MEWTNIALYLMESDDRIEKLLEEIRDIQREQLAEYRRVTQQSLELQKNAVERQKNLGKLYTRMAGVGAGLIIPLLALLLYLLVRFSNRLF